MSCFLTPFIRECYKLYHEGFQWKNPSNGELITSKVVTLHCVLDSVAKPKVQGVRQFNGYFGCNYCYHPGVKIPEHPHPRYLIDDEVTFNDTDFGCTYTATRPDVDDEEEAGEMFDVSDRTNESLREEMDEVMLTQHEHTKGAKTKSIMCLLTFFNIVFGFSLDYLHAVLIGVVKLVVTLSFDSKSNGKPYYLKHKLLEIDKRLKNIKPPSSISRRPRTLDDLPNWHANEFRAFLLYYSVPCFVGIMRPDYLKHHCLLVTGISILLQDRISKQDLKNAALYLSIYVKDFARLYGDVYMHFNIHLLLHLSKFVFMYGPLWCFSAFCFESGNGVLVKLVKGTVSVASQIARKYIMANCAPKMGRLFNVRDNCVEFCSELLSYPVVSHSEKSGPVTLLGLPVHHPLSAEEMQALTEAGHNLVTQTYQRMIMNKIKYHSWGHYTRQGAKSNDSIVKLSDMSYGLIERILLSKIHEEESVYMIVRQINIDRAKFVVAHQCGAKSNHIKVCSAVVFGALRVVSHVDITRKCILIDTGRDRAYVADIPNFFEKD